MRKFAKPIVVISKCLELEACRYNGQVIPDDFVKKLKPHVTFLPSCPEVEIGLGVPREPVRIISVKGQNKLIQPATGKDLTDIMLRFADKFLNSLEEVDGFILKSRSPSCGIKDVKVYQGIEKGAATGKSTGFFAGKVLEMFPGLAIEDEGRLRNFKIREHFLTKLFALASFRNVKKTDLMGKLIHFHTENKFLLMAYNQKELGILGGIVANHEKKKFREVVTEYEEHFKSSLSRIPRRNSHINVLMHTLGYFSKQLSSNEKAFFLELLEKYRNDKIPISAVLSVARAWIIKFEEKYLTQQSFFEPYPEDLVEITDSGKGRNL